ncbi:AraC family transcriptional regulator [Ottowia thiooxydans]|uniref:AraC family transcriptional regulator n=1 Tax=Ottowia thiooxydans TaxID=219182 RepID=UPI0003FF0312|nr:AraC family transcriptional regulator [Ottowia thiooxydans]
MAKDLKQREPRENPGALIAPVFVFGMLSGLERQGMNVDGFLRQVGVDPRALRTPGDQGVTPMQYVALFYALMNDLKDECLGLFSRPFKPGSFALTAREGLSATDLRSAIKRMAVALNLLQDDVTFSLQVDGDEAGLHMQWIAPDSEAPVFLEETMVRVLWRLAAWLLNAPLPILHFDFTYPEPSHHEGYNLVFPAPRRYQQSAFGFWFTASKLRTPVSRDEPALRAFLTDAYTQIISPPRDFGVVGQKVRNYLMRSYPRWPSLPEVAEQLHFSPATLQRRLAAENTSLQWLKDDLRRDLAISRLSTSRVSLAQLATELGFSDSPTFQRAFKAWTGKNCGAYRRR